MAKSTTRNPSPEQAADAAREVLRALDPLDHALGRIDDATTPWDKASAAAGAARQARELLADHERRLLELEAAAKRSA